MSILARLLNNLVEKQTTEFDNLSGSPVALSSASWVTIHTESSIADGFKITAINITISGGSPTNPVLRILRERLS